MQATERFTRRADQVPAARFFVGDTLRRWGVTSRLDDVVLMTSELFTNAVLHGDGAVQVSLCLFPTSVRLEVTDDGGSGTAAGHEIRSIEVAPEQITGRGLGIVERLADTWGAGPDRSGRTCVWAEILRV